MSESGRAYVQSLITQHDLEPDVFLAPPAFQAEPISFGNLSVSTDNDIDVPEFETHLYRYLAAPVSLGRLLAAYRDVVCTGDYASTRSPLWEMSGTIVRDALKDPRQPARALTDIDLQPIDPRGLSNTMRRRVLPRGPYNPVVEGTSFAFIAQAQHVGRTVACILGIQIRHSAVQSDIGYIAGRVRHTYVLPTDMQ